MATLMVTLKSVHGRRGSADTNGSRSAQGSRILSCLSRVQSRATSYPPLPHGLCAKVQTQMVKNAVFMMHACQAQRITAQSTLIITCVWMQVQQVWQMQIVVAAQIDAVTMPAWAPLQTLSTAMRTAARTSMILAGCLY